MNALLGLSPQVHEDELLHQLDLFARHAATAGRDALRTSAEYRFGCFLACSLVLRSDIVETHLRAGPLSESLLSAGGEEAEALVRGRRVGARALSAALLIAAKLMANQEAKDILHHEQCLAAYLHLACSSLPEAQRFRAELDTSVSEAAAKCITNSVVQNLTGQQILARLGAAPRLVALALSPCSTTTALCAVRALLHMASSPSVESKGSVLESAELVDMCLLTLAECVRRRAPPFPLGRDRVALLNEVLALMYALTAGSSLAALADQAQATRFGVLLCELLLQPDVSAEVVSAKLRAAQVLMDCPPDYAHFLAANGCIAPLLQLLHHALVVADVEHEPARVSLLPVLAVLQRCAASSKQFARLVSMGVFPPSPGRAHVPGQEASSSSEEEEENEENEEEEQARHAEPQRLEQADGGIAGAGPGAGGGAGAARPPPARAELLPADAPPDTLRGRLIKQMTSTDPLVKRFANELLFELCGRSDGEFMRRAGTANALGFLVARQGGLEALAGDQG